MTIAHSLFFTPTIFAGHPHVVAAQSTRHGGVSTAPFASLNLGLYTEDEPDLVRENRRRFFSALGIDAADVAHSRQIHGEEILLVKETGAYEGYDALITNRPNVFCTVTVADCTPILVYDLENQAVAAIHAGWRGTVRQIVYKTLSRMHAEFGTQGRHCRAYVGVCIDECSYEVGPDVAEHFQSPHKRFDHARNKYLINLKMANKDQLLAAGVPESQIEVSSHCTFLQNDRYFSHRKESGRTGRMLALIGVRA